MIDERTEELAALYAFDLLEGAELDAFTTRLQNDKEVRKLVDELRETSSACALTAASVEPSAGLRERVLASVMDQTTSSARSSNIIPFRLPAWPAWAAAAVFALLAGYLGLTVSQLDYQLAVVEQSQVFADLQMRSLQTSLDSEQIVSKQQAIELKTTETQLAAVRDQLDETRTSALAQISELKAEANVAALKISSLNSLLGNAPDATAIAVWNPFSQEGVLTVSKLPALDADKDYQLWVVDPQYSIPVDGGVFTVDATTGETRFKFKTDKPIKTVAAFAVSLERKGGVPKAEGPMVLITQ